jgi:hypothetical protein
MDYAFCLLTVNSSDKWRSPLFGATCNFNDQIIPYLTLLIETLLFGDDSLSEEQNTQIVNSVQLYIKQTKRFTPVITLHILNLTIFFCEHFLRCWFTPTNMTIMYCYNSIYYIISKIFFSFFSQCCYKM